MPRLSLVFALHLQCPPSLFSPAFPLEPSLRTRGKIFSHPCPRKPFRAGHLPPVISTFGYSSLFRSDFPPVIFSRDLFADYRAFAFCSLL